MDTTNYHAQLEAHWNTTWDPSERVHAKHHAYINPSEGQLFNKQATLRAIRVTNHPSPTPITTIKSLERIERCVRSGELDTATAVLEAILTNILNKNNPAISGFMNIKR